MHVYLYMYFYVRSTDWRSVKSPQCWCLPSKKKSFTGDHSVAVKSSWSISYSRSTKARLATRNTKQRQIQIMQQSPPVLGFVDTLLFLWNSSKPSTWDILGVMLSRTLPGLLALESRRCRVEAAAVAEATLIVGVTWKVELYSQVVLTRETNTANDVRFHEKKKHRGIMITLTHTQINGKALFH